MYELKRIPVRKHADQRGFVPLQLLSQRQHTGAAGPASAPWPSTVRLWETGSAWAGGLDSQRGRRPRSRTAWCSAAARWGSGRGFVWGLRGIHLTGTELCVWASPTWILSVLCLCPPWPSPTSLTDLGTGPLPCISPTAMQVQSWSSGWLRKAPYTSHVTIAGSKSCSQEWTSASRCGPW